MDGGQIACIVTDDPGIGLLFQKLYLMTGLWVYKFHEIQISQRILMKSTDYNKIWRFLSRNSKILLELLVLDILSEQEM